MKLRTAFSVRERMKSSIGISFTSRFFKSACLPNFDEQSYPQSKMRTRAIRVAFIVVGFALLSISPACGEPENISSVKLNPTALTYAKELISGGHVVLDRKSAWAKDKPSTELENEFIRQRGFGEYAKWHLGIDGRYPDNTKRRYKFPLWRFQKCSSLWGACCPEQGSRVQILRNRKCGGSAEGKARGNSQRNALRQYVWLALISTPRQSGTHRSARAVRRCSRLPGS
jgi:hypothetical protein